MAYVALAVTAPTGTTYDSENPTQGTEELNMTLHAILQDMEDANFVLNDDCIPAGHWTTIENWMVAEIDKLFDYAAQAIEDYRAEDPISITIPTSSMFAGHTYAAQYPSFNKFQFTFLASLYKMAFLIYYLWKTETDPARVKDYIRDMLLAWPLQDIAINLKDEGGSDLRVYPQWNNLET